MLQTLKLLIPAILPSWNFFDYITPSPRVQFRLIATEAKVSIDWQEYRPRPDHLSFSQMLGRMLWNSHWNETMFIAGCAERIAVNHNAEHNETEILERIVADLLKEKATVNAAVSIAKSTHVQFRLVFIERVNDELVEETVFHSRIKKLPNVYNA